MNQKKKFLLSVMCNEEEELKEENQMQIINLFKSDDDETDMLLRLWLTPKRKRNSIKKYAEEVVPSYWDEEFVTHFRINPDLFNNLSQRLESASIYSRMRIDKRLPASKYMLVFLWCAAHEACSFRDISDRFNISLSTVNHIINLVTMFLSNMSDDVISWPSSLKINERVLYFENKSCFPKVIGAIDGTHILIDPPKNGKDDYIDRKGHTTICLQGICNEDRKFIDIFVGYPGSTHDSRVFQNSFIYPKLGGLCNDNWILGDSAYPLQINLLTPYKDNGHLTAPQKHYNVKLSCNRVVIEHTFGILKQRFRQLYYCKLRGIEKLCHFIRACCVLHNLAKETDLDFSEVLQSDANEDDEIDDDDTAPSAIAKALRDSVCAQLRESRLT